MNFENVKTAPCVVESSPTTVCGSSSTGDPSCADPEYAYDHPDLCPGAPTVTAFEVRPATATLQVGGKQQFAAYLVFSDGREKDVTALAAWKTLNSAFATVESGGLVTGVAVGGTSVQAEYRSLFDSSPVTVIAACSQGGLDVVLAIDRSGSMMEKAPDGKTRLEKAVAAAKAFVQNLIPTKDQCSVVSFAGNIEERAGQATLKTSDTTTHIVLSPVKDDVFAALDSIKVNEPCTVEPSVGVRLYRCATSIGGGLQAAYDELKSSRGVALSRKVVILLTDGTENICNPVPETVAAAMKAKNYTIVVIALAVPNENCKKCDGSSTTVHAYLTSLTSCSLFFTAATADDLLEIYSRLVWRICDGNLNNNCFYYIPVYSVPSTPSCQSPKLDYNGFKNWDVVQGYVDLIGVGTNNVALYDLFPGHGLYVDLVGTNLSQPVLASKRAVGAMETKTRFKLNPGRYKLSVKFGGNRRQDTGGTALQVQVSVGNFLSQTVGITNWQQALTTYSWQFVVSDPATAPIRIEHLPLPSFMTPTIGTVMDDVKLENLDTGEVLLNDSFDTENPC